ncbi:MAG: transposase [Chitinophagaceae bacterium]|nr:transposase [Rubrivivax sp.]
MRAIHEQHGDEYGWPRMHKELLARGHRVGKEHVRQFMQRHCLRAKGKRKFVVTTDSAHRLPVVPTLCSAASIRQRLTSSGPATSPTSRQTRAGCTWRPSSICTAVRWWAEACNRTSRPRWGSVAIVQLAAARSSDGCGSESWRVELVCCGRGSIFDRVELALLDHVHRLNAG